MICPYCKSNNPADNKACRYCGQMLKGSGAGVVIGKDESQTVDAEVTQPSPWYLKAPIFLGVTLIFLIQILKDLSLSPVLILLFYVGGIILLVIGVIIQIVITANKKHWGVAIVILGIGLYYGFYLFSPFLQGWQFYSVVKDINQAYSEENVDKVMIDAQKLIKLSATDTSRAIAYQWLGVAYYMQGNISEAQKNEAEAIQLDPTNIKPFIKDLQNQSHSKDFSNLINLAMQAWRQNKNDDIAKYAQQALDLAQNDNERAQANYWLGIGQYRQNKLAAAEKSELTAIQLLPDFVGPYVTMGAIKLDQNKVTDARRYAQKAVSLDPSYEWVNNIMGLVLLAENKPDQAIPYFQKALESSPGTVVFVNNLRQAKQLAGIK